jgi:hypothetical protein
MKPAAEGPTAHAAGPVDDHDLELTGGGLELDAQALLSLQRSVGNEALNALLSIDRSSPTASSEVEAFMNATGVVHPALQALSRSLKPAEGLFGGPSSTYGANPPRFATESAENVLHAGKPSPSKHAEFPKVMGQTMYERNAIGLWPSFSVTYHTPFWHWLSTTAVPNKTKAEGATWWAVATPANEEGYKMENGLAEYPGYDYYIKVSSKAAAMIVEAEQQHINDLDQGWAITGENAANSINAVSDEEPDVKPSAHDAKNAAADRVAAKMGGVGDLVKGAIRSGGRLEEALAPLMMGANNASLRARDKSGQHTIPTKFSKKDDAQKRVTFEVDDGFDLKAPSSESVVNAGTIAGG